MRSNGLRGFPQSHSCNISVFSRFNSVYQSLPRSAERSGNKTLTFSLATYHRSFSLRALPTAVSLFFTMPTTFGCVVHGSLVMPYSQVSRIRISRKVNNFSEYQVKNQACLNRISEGCISDNHIKHLNICII